MGCIVLFGTLATLFLILEGVLRLAGRTSDNFLKQDAVLGWRHMPDKEGWSVTREYRVPVKINNFGLVGPETTLEKPTGTFRIAFVGDSLTEAFQVNPEASFPRLVEGRLNDLVGKKKIEALALSKVEVLNFGVTSYGTVKEAYVIEKEVLKFNPDLVVLGFFTGNDFYNNLEEKVNPQAQFTVWQKIKNWKKLWWRNHSTAYRWFLEKKARLSFSRKNLGGQARNQSFIPSGYGSGSIFGENYSEETQMAMAKTQEYFKKIKNVAVELQIPVLILILPSKEQVHEMLRAPDDQNLDWAKPHKILREFLTKENMLYLDTLPIFQSWAKINPKGLAFFKFDGHPNETGHWLIAKGLLEYLWQNNYGK